MSSNQLVLYGPINRVRTPKFGSCLDKCVLGHDACVTQSGAQLYKPPFESEEDCTKPDDVIVGRCTSSLDDERCGPTESACGTKSPFYEPIDNLCSIVDDDKDDLDGKRTTFPACQRLDDVDVYQCVLDDSECKEGERKVYAKWAEDWGPQSCHCEDVPTGVCYKYDPNTHSPASQDLLTPENSFCAVSQDDCPSDHQWMAARDFLKSNKAIYQCRLCDAQTIQGAYPAGACLSSTAGHYDACALESIDCDDGSTFVSSAQLEQQGLFCPIEHTQNWGICGSLEDKVECTNKMDSCLYNFRFEQSDNLECNIHFSESGLPTYFPYCSPRTDNDEKDWRDVRCVWDRAECDKATERWEEVRLPNDAWFQGCTCEDVLTGVCQDPSTGDYHCGVSAQACEDPSSYVLQRDLQAQGIDMECRLCSPTSRPPPPPTFSPVPPPSTAPVSIPPPTFRPTFALPSPTKMPSNPTTKSPTVPTAWPNVQELSKNESNDLSQGAIIGIAIAGAVVCGLIVVIVTLATGTKKERAPQKQMYPNANADDEDSDPEVVIDEAPIHQASATLT